MLKCEGYKMFYGTMLISPRPSPNPKFPTKEPFEVTGTWLYKPDTGCWYCNGSSYVEGVCKIISEEGDPTISNE